MWEVGFCENMMPYKCICSSVKVDYEHVDMTVLFPRLPLEALKNNDLKGLGELHFL